MATKRDTGEMAGENTVERAYAYLRDRTVSFGFRPGERINEVELAGILGMSRAPVREALNRLIADGLVLMEPGRGFFCRRLSAREVVDLFAVRADLEVSAVLAIAADGDMDAVAELAKAWNEVLENEENLTIEELVSADEAFHLQLVALAGNAERLRYLDNINARIRFVRRINLEDAARRKASLAEHALILEALVAGDGGAAAVLVARHLSISSEEVLAHIHTGLAQIYANEVA